MSEHKYGLGQKVQFNGRHHTRSAPVGFYEVVRQLPDLDGDLQYRIKSSREAHERVVKESELQRV